MQITNLKIMNINREELNLITRSALSAFYINGFTNTGNNFYRLMLSEYERLKSCKELRVEFEVLKHHRPSKEVSMEDSMLYRPIEYFDTKSIYLFYDDTKYFVSKVHKYNGSLYTNESLNYKVTTLRAKLIENKI